MITIYGIAASRAFRTYWMAEELGLEYQRVPLDFHGDGLRQPEYLALNPNGRIPTLCDGDFVIWESMAINSYLAEKYDNGRGLWPDSVESRALTGQWTHWVMSEVEGPLLTCLMHSRVLPEDKRDPAKASRSQGLLRKPFTILDAALADREYLVDDRFTVADLNVAAVLSWAKPARLDLKPYPRLDAWLKRCLDRPARKRAQTEPQ
jgi:glutathione S-transferase